MIQLTLTVRSRKCPTARRNAQRYVCDKHSASQINGLVHSRAFRRNYGIIDGYKTATVPVANRPCAICAVPHA